MYIRASKTTNHSNSKEYNKYQLVKTTRVDGKPTNEIIMGLGCLKGFTDTQIKLLENRIVNIYTNQKVLPLEIQFDKNVESMAEYFVKRLLKKIFAERKIKFGMQINMEPDYKEVDINSFIGDSSVSIGGEYLCYQAIEELALADFFEKVLKWDELQVKQALIALQGRLLYPGSESCTEKWINENSAILDFYPMATAQINRNQLYKAALTLYKQKNAIQVYINNKIQDIFHQTSKILLFDLTNFHFEGQMKKAKKCKYGRNKQKRNDCKQISMGLVVDERGFCRYSNYYDGNISEGKTLSGVLDDLKASTSNAVTEKRLIIMDAGIATQENIALLLQKGYDYIVISRKKHNQLLKQVNPEDLVSFTNKTGEELKAKAFVEPIEYEDSDKGKQIINETIVYIETPAKYQKEKSMDENKCKKFETGLQAIQVTVNNPRGQKSIEQIHQRLGRLKEKCKGVTGYFDIDIQNNGKEITAFNYTKKAFEKKEKELGTYFIRTSLQNKDEETIWKVYRTINEVEDVFHTLKTDLHTRPNYHQLEQNIEAHLNLSVLAYNVISFLRYKLKQSDIKYGWKEIRRIMGTQHVTLQAVNTRDKKTLWLKSCTRPHSEVFAIYKALGYKNMPFYRQSAIV